MEQTNEFNERLAKTIETRLKVVPDIDRDNQVNIIQVKCNPEDRYMDLVIVDEEKSEEEINVRVMWMEM